MATKKKPAPKKAKAKAKAKKPTKLVKIPRQKALPGMEDTKIIAIENAALDYAEIRDQRQELTKQEVDLKSKLSKLMHDQGKTEYRRNGISVEITTEKEKVRVRVRDEDDSSKEEPEETTPELPTEVEDFDEEAEAS